MTAVARTRELLEEVTDQLSTAAGQEHDFLCADLADPRSLSRKVQDLVGDHAPYQILINNTGGPPAGPLVEADPEAFLEGFTRHVIASQVLAQTLVPGMRQSGYGRIINIISISVRAPIPGLGVSNTIRGAMAAWAKTMAGELGPQGITVNSVLPGYTDTERLTELIQWKADKNGISAAELAAAMKAEVPAGRFASPAETAAAVAFLATPAAGYINGITLPVDGGRLPTI